VETVSGANSCKVYFLAMVEEHLKEGGDLGLNGLGVPAVVLFVPPSSNSCDLYFPALYLLACREQLSILLSFCIEVQQVMVQSKKAMDKAKSKSQWYVPQDC
jgi:hypothetical protein